MGSSIRLEGDVKGLLRRINQFAYLDKKAVSAAMAEAVRTSTVERFKKQTDPQGKRWKPSIRAQREGGVTLSDKGRLRNSIKSKSDASGFAVGTNLIYAATHQQGEKGRRITIRAKTSKGLVFRYKGRWMRKQQVKIAVKIPARPFLGLSEEDMQEIKGTVEDALRED
ncbi:phage virion morphogenesis protein [Harryflintia acetispora]|uniref:Phage virion morphogenesis protein n=1 Tax=Harryflintia acetispora TaxID=1849041 RepID=A0A9X8Y833_9FIRM|nr:phage virion morphogenesis protein [Harryflintia acetispora]TCL43218.1 phage virion morphogenesis protein [Harryflintia acetispora]